MYDDGRSLLESLISFFLRMGTGLASGSAVLFLLILALASAEDSLRSALNAVTRRQRDLTDLSRYGEYYNDAARGYDDVDNLDFLNPQNDPGRL